MSIVKIMIYGACGTLICVTDAKRKIRISKDKNKNELYSGVLKGSICALGIGDGVVETFNAELVDS